MGVHKFVKDNKNDILIATTGRYDSKMMLKVKPKIEHKAQKAKFWRTASVDGLKTFNKLLKAAKRGNVAAQNEVSECYKTGKMSVQINKTEAQKWHSTAVRRDKVVAKQ